MIPMDDAWPTNYGPLERPDDLLELVKPELAPDERLLWASRADQAAAPRRRGGHAAAGTWAVGLLAAGSACLFFSIHPNPLIHRAEATLITFAIVFLMIGSLIGIFTIASLVSTARVRRLRSRRIYAVTDRRAILWTPVDGSDAVTVHVYPRGSIKPGQIERTQFPDGSGTLALLGGYSAHGNFEGIANVRRVEELVRRFLVAPDPDPAP